jgi:hypothetical protein
MSNVLTTLYDRNGRAFFKTDAPNGYYIAYTNLTCRCCGERIVADSWLVVKDGFIDEGSLGAACSEIYDGRGKNPIPEKVLWGGGVSFVLKYSRDKTTDFSV